MDHHTCRSRADNALICLCVTDLASHKDSYRQVAYIVPQ